MKYFCSLCFLIISFNLFAQEPFTLGKIEKIQSSVLKESRTLNIYLPEGYAVDSAKTYPVIYLLDGSANEDFIHIVGLVQFLTMIETMPKSIVVGIANVDRKRDFTFPTTIKEDLKDYPTTGKSEKFISFIEKELQPFIQNNYKTNESKTIIGQSLGGLLATEILLKKPQLFDNYMIISPSLWWNNESLLGEAPKYLEQQTKTNLRVYLSVGTEGKVMEGDTRKLAEILKQRTNLKLDFLPLPDESHLTILHNSIYKGFGILCQKKK
ncbi:alpha/beta hydrolase [Pedobacter paludis]|uniref:Esterase n=1 Tax=Pedobacter paludis TaxID=2203212 RepID=A0A317EWI9_9SPHI|nr:alpha/beta hydrolase-fold protein [Pedobacter paludis]PWS30822.1 esterase [Pedobacter paludis]